MSIRARIVVAVALHEIDNAPDTKPGSKCYNKGLQNVYCAIENAINKSFLPRLRLSGKRTKGGQRMPPHKKPPSGKGGCPRAA